MISNNDKAYIIMSALEISYKKCSEILSHYSAASDFLTALENDDNFLVQLFEKDFHKYKKRYTEFSFDTFEVYLNKKQVGYVTIEHNNYPQKLLKLEQPPFILFYMGDFNLINTKCIAMVGTRNPSFYGKDITAKFAEKLCLAGLTIVSGLSVGVDKISHETALKNNGKTIAVLGCGFEYFYPPININLANEMISKNNLILTEYYPTYKARIYSFPARNRIIAALSEGVLITEAAQKSGSLHTKNFALEIGLNVYAVPGNITSPKSDGTNNIIKFGHAACVTCPEDILNDYGIEAKNQQKEEVQLNFEEQKIYKFLLDGEKNFDDLQNFTGFSVQILNTYLTTLQIRGIIKKLPGNFYSV